MESDAVMGASLQTFPTATSAFTPLTILASGAAAEKARSVGPAFHGLAPGAGRMAGVAEPETMKARRLLLCVGEARPRLRSEHAESSWMW